MSTQEFKPGDRVRLRDGVSPVSGHEGTREFTVEAMSLSGRAVALVGVGGYRGIDRFELVQRDATQPEDATDAYVEPEPLKEGDPDTVTINTLDREEIDRFIRALPAHWSLVNDDDTIDSDDITDVQDAFQTFATPPKPARCTSLLYDGFLAALIRCGHGEGHGGDHGTDRIGWDTAEESGRITEGGAS